MQSKSRYRFVTNTRPQTDPYLSDCRFTMWGSWSVIAEGREWKGQQLQFYPDVIVTSHTKAKKYLPLYQFPDDELHRLFPLLKASVSHLRSVSLSLIQWHQLTTIQSFPPWFILNAESFHTWSQQHARSKGSSAFDDWITSSIFLWSNFSETFVLPMFHPALLRGGFAGCRWIVWSDKY